MDRAQDFASRHLSAQPQRDRRQGDGGQACSHSRGSWLARADRSGRDGGWATSPRRLVDQPGLLMAAYRKFSDALQREMSATAPPKPAKAPKVDLIETGTLGGLGALGDAEPQIQISAPPIAALDRAAAWGEAEA